MQTGVQQEAQQGLEAEHNGAAVDAVASGASGESRTRNLHTMRTAPQEV